VRTEVAVPNDLDARHSVGDDVAVFVAEVKSITNSNEEKQLRLGLGQAFGIGSCSLATGHRAVAALVAERAPPDPWHALCDELGVVLTWPGAFYRVVGSEGVA
jgi:hypothetical protein